MHVLKAILLPLCLICCMTMVAGGCQSHDAVVLGNLLIASELSKTCIICEILNSL